MKIVVNTRFLLKDKLEGIGWFTYETLKILTRRHLDIEFVFLFDRPYHSDFIFSENVRPVVISPPARHPLLWYLWFEFSVPYLLKKEKPDLFLSPDGYLSLRTNVPTTLVIHDLAFEHYSQHVDKLVLKYYKHFTPKFASRAKRIATVSQFSKNDLISTYQVEASKIDVVYNGADEMYLPTSVKKQEEIRNIYSDGKEYFLFVGAIQPRKNISNLFKAFDLFKETDNKDTKLMIVGRKGWSTDDIYATYKSMKHKKDVIFTGRVNNTELKYLYGAARALTYIPLFEGFGIPIIEAQQCHCPVITSNVTSLPEVAGNSACLVDPLSIESIKNALVKLSMDETYRISLIDLAKENVKRFSWEKTADSLWDSMMKTLKL